MHGRPPPPTHRDDRCGCSNSRGVACAHEVCRGAAALGISCRKGIASPSLPYLLLDFLLLNLNGRARGNRRTHRWAKNDKVEENPSKEKAGTKGLSNQPANGQARQMTKNRQLASNADKKGR